MHRRSFKILFLETACKNTLLQDEHTVPERAESLKCHGETRETLLQDKHSQSTAERREKQAQAEAKDSQTESCKVLPCSHRTQIQQSDAPSDSHRTDCLQTHSYHRKHHAKAGEEKEKEEADTGYKESDTRE